MLFAPVITLLFSALPAAAPVTEEDASLKTRQEAECRCPEGYWVWRDYNRGKWGKDACRNDDGRIISRL
ncbi:unnamed protein product [Clonostachys chloroleuca]|uniref:Uncharacterized protein n=1 Tax=Clonostachys chloroleuca TaxID=1926264 RepID=A0AA35M0Z5_9HYPO|nr:unnamed protein product [Clonostachys chloroleuca]